MTWNSSVANYHFLLTYSVSPVNKLLSSHRDSSDAMRKKIAQIDENLWTKLVDVETTFIGTMYLTGDSNILKRVQARKQVIKVFKDLIVEHNSLDKVNVDIALMVNGLGAHLELQI